MHKKQKQVRDYTKDVAIDLSDLEGDWAEQPAIYQHYSELWADATEAKDLAKMKLENLVADLDYEIRLKPYLYGIEKITEPAIKAAISRNKDRRKLEELFIKATRMMNTMKGVQTSFEHRKKALENEVTLLVTGFHSEPRNKIRDLNETQRKANHANHTKGLKRRKKAKIKKTE